MTTAPAYYSTIMAHMYNSHMIIMRHSKSHMRVTWKSDSHVIDIGKSHALDPLCLVLLYLMVDDHFETD